MYTHMRKHRSIAIERPKTGASLHSLVLHYIFHTHIFTYICDHTCAPTRQIAVERSKSITAQSCVALQLPHTYIHVYMYTRIYIYIGQWQ